MTTAACSPRGRYQKRGIGMTSRDICVMRFASSRCCSSACGIRTFAKSTQADEQVARAQRGRLAVALDRPSSAGLPWRVSTTERARSYANEAACPPAVPTSAQRHGGAIPWARSRSSRSVATVRAPPPDHRSAVPWNCSGVPAMPLPGAVPVSIPQVPLRRRRRRPPRGRAAWRAAGPAASRSGRRRPAPRRRARRPGRRSARSARGPRRGTGRAAARRARSLPATANAFRPSARRISA